MKLFLDDFRNLSDVREYMLQSLRHHYAEGDDWVIVRSYDQFLNYLQKHLLAGKPPITLVSFDHDLDKEHYQALHHPIIYDKFKVKTGYDCAKKMVELYQSIGMKLPETILSHSMNAAGRDNIFRAMKGLPPHSLKSDKDKAVKIIYPDYLFNPAKDY